MIFKFTCRPCGIFHEIDAKPFTPPLAPACPECDQRMDRVYGCQIDTSGCKDHDDIPEQSRIACGAGTRNLTSGQVARMEAACQQDIQAKRQAKLAGGNRGNIRMTNSIPAALFHGKIKETGDKHYWDDPHNRKRHKSTEV